MQLLLARASDWRLLIALLDHRGFMVISLYNHLSSMTSSLKQRSLLRSCNPIAKKQTEHAPWFVELPWRRMVTQMVITTGGRLLLLSTK